MRVTQAYRFALDPTPRQMRALASHVGAARFAFNWGLDSSRIDLTNAPQVLSSTCHGRFRRYAASGIRPST